MTSPLNIENTYTIHARHFWSKPEFAQIVYIQENGFELGMKEGASWKQ
jgi:hypothetical protein